MKEPKIIAAIPARFSSTRFPGKPLAMIAGRPMIEWVVEGTLKSKLVDEVWILTDDERIQQAVKSMPVRAMLTPSNLPSGTDRIWYAVQRDGLDASSEDAIVVNVQGDEPLINGDVIDELIQPLLSDPKLAMSTLAQDLAEEDLLNLNSVKVLSNRRQEAIYFSRFPIPYSRVSFREAGKIPGLGKHVGLYAYRLATLKKIAQQAPLPVERAEGLEQLRALYLGIIIHVGKTSHQSLGVDSPEDVQRVEAILSKN